MANTGEDEVEAGGGGRSARDPKGDPSPGVVGSLDVGERVTPGGTLNCPFCQRGQCCGVNERLKAIAKKLADKRNP